MINIDHHTESRQARLKALQQPPLIEIAAAILGGVLIIIMAFL